MQKANELNLMINHSLENKSKRGATDITNDKRQIQKRLNKGKAILKVGNPSVMELNKLAVYKKHLMVEEEFGSQKKELKQVLEFLIL